MKQKIEFDFGGKTWTFQADFAFSLTTKSVRQRKLPNPTIVAKENKKKTITPDSA